MNSPETTEITADHPGKRVIRCVLAKVGLDGHQRGVQVIARDGARRDSRSSTWGCAIPRRRRADSGRRRRRCRRPEHTERAHLHLTRATRAALDAGGGAKIPLLVGGVIPRQDIEPMKQVGAAEVLLPGSKLSEVVDAVLRVVS